MTKAIFDYQNDNDVYESRVKFVFDVLAEVTNKTCGGFADKDVLEIGAGFHMAHGGVFAFYALDGGARSCCSIDVDHPELIAGDTNRVEFFHSAFEKRKFNVGKVENNHINLADRNYLIKGVGLSKFSWLQMDCSNMFFKDELFDLVISNATLEHIQEPRAAILEMYRVLRKGGQVCLSWNPFTSFAMGGHNLGVPFYYPWAHLRLDEQEHIEILRKVYSDSKWRKEAFPAEHQATDEWANLYLRDLKSFYKNVKASLNEMRIHEFLNYAKSAGFEVVSDEYYINEDHRKYLTTDIKRELNEYSERELLMTAHMAVLKKPL